MVAIKKYQAAQLKKPPIMWLLGVQLLLLTVLSLAMVMIDLVAVKSAALGGLISVIPNAYFMRWAFRYSGASVATQVAQSFYRGEAGKFLFTTILFAGVFTLVEPFNVVVLFSVYVFMMALNWILALHFLSK